MNMVLSAEQQDAVDLCTNRNNRIASVTGQAGTGKTTILRAVFDELASELGVAEMDFEDIRECPIFLCAPTGRAAKRIEEATGLAAMTIHRMLRFTTPKDEEDITLPRHDKFNPLPCDVILVDEASMIDESLWRSLVDAMKGGCIVRFFGDVNQLPPVEGKSPFARALEKFPAAWLSHNYRSDDGIISVADRIIKGFMPMANDQVRVHRIKNVDTFGYIRDICNEIDFTVMNRQIISPTNATKYGCEPINTFIQQRYNPEKEKLTVYKKDREGNVLTTTFKRGDKVLWTKNNYDLGIMNGTLGIVQTFNKDTGELLVTFDDNDIVIPPSIEGFNPTTGERYRYDPRSQMQLGYAVTTHKSQGSQFDLVLYVISLSRAATRQNVYTAITRAKNNLIILNVSGALATALDKKVEI